MTYKIPSGCALLLAVVLGCVGDYPTPMEPEPFTAPMLSERFDANNCGTITGQVVWQGIAPTIPTLQAGIRSRDGSYQWKEMPAAYTPKIDPRTHGIADVLVSLQKIDLQYSKPWDIPDATVHLQDDTLIIHQGDRKSSRIGIVRLGDRLTFHSQADALHMVRGRGAAYFTLPLPAESQPTTKRFTTPGVVELSSGIGYIWMAAQLHVVEHPYHAVTDEHGQFTLKDVPAGTYTIRYTLPSWKVAQEERDPETGLILRQRYTKEIVREVSVKVIANEPSDVPYIFSIDDFDPNADGN